MIPLMPLMPGPGLREVAQRKAARNAQIGHLPSLRSAATAPQPRGPVFIGLEFASPTHDVKIWFITYPANTNVLVSLVSFGVSGIYLSFLLTVIGSMIARARGWVPAGRFTLGRWAWPVSVVAVVYLGLMLVNVVLPSGLTGGRDRLEVRGSVKRCPATSRVGDRRAAPSCGCLVLSIGESAR